MGPRDRRQEAGLSAAGDAGVSVQLHAQAAKAWTRIGDPVRAAEALYRGRELLERTATPPDTRNHFVIDPAKWDLYAMDCARRTGDDDLAATLADAVIQNSTTPGGIVVSPMRVAEAELTHAAVQARAGNSEQAIATAMAALQSDRRSLPSLILVGQEVADLIDHQPAGRDFRQHLATLRPTG